MVTTCPIIYARFLSSESPPRNPNNESTTCDDNDESPCRRCELIRSITILKYLIFLIFRNMFLLEKKGCSVAQNVPPRFVTPSPRAYYRTLPFQKNVLTLACSYFELPSRGLVVECNKFQHR